MRKREDNVSVNAVPWYRAEMVTFRAVGVWPLVPGFLCAALPLWGFFGAERLGQWFRERISTSWSTAPASVVSSDLLENGEFHVVSVYYEFWVAGDRYGGEFERTFREESEARNALDRLLAAPPLVRYKTGRPDTAILVES